MVNFSTHISDCDSHSSALLNFFLSSDASICSTMAFPPLRNSDVVVSVSIDFPLYARADWDGLRDHLRYVPWEDIFKLSGFRLELMYISLIESIRSSLVHLRGFQLLVLLS